MSFKKLAQGFQLANRRLEFGAKSKIRQHFGGRLRPPIVGIAFSHGLLRFLRDALAEQDRQVATEFFALEDGCLVTRVPVMPSMLTCNPEVIRQDCLCYLMERYNDHLVDAG